MKRERLQKLFSEDKEIFQGGMLFPTWICKGKEEIENRNIPQRAAVYLDIPIPYCPEEILQTMEMLQSFQVQIDCIGYGILDYARLKQYLMHTWEKQEQFEQELDAYLCSCCTRERI